MALPKELRATSLLLYNNLMGSKSRSVQAVAEHK